MPCSDGARQRQKIIHNQSGFGRRREREWATGGSGSQDQQENPPMRIYLIGNDGIALCREAPAAVNDGEIVVASKEELQATPLNGKRLCLVERAARCR